MKKLIIALVVVVAIAVAFVAVGPFYVLEEGEQAVAVRLGKIVSVQTEAGLKMKTPFLDSIVRFPKKVMPWDGEPQRIPTKENQFIWVDATARWRIVDPTQFYESMSSLENAYGRLDDVIDSAVRTIVSSNYLREIVRDSNRLVGSGSTETFQTGNAESSADLNQLTQSTVSYEKIDKGRTELSNVMLALVAAIVPQFGIEVIDIVPRQIKYSDEMTESVYSRMIKERNQIAQAFRGDGEGKKQELLGKLENEKLSVLSRAYAEAETIKGKADAEAAGIYAKTYGRDPSFYEFWRAIESYRQTLPNFTKTLSTDLEYFRYLYSPSGR